MTYGRGGPPLWTLVWLHISCWLNVLQQSRFDVLVIQCGVVVVVVRGGDLSL